MISTGRGGAQFKYRVTGIFLDGDRTLLCRTEGGDYWFLPGGKVEFLEATGEALEREMREEVGAEVAAGRLVWVVENFYEHSGETVHESCFHHLIRFPAEFVLHSEDTFVGYEPGLKLIFKWTPLELLRTAPQYPVFLRDGLRSLPEYTEHLVLDERR